MNGPSRTVRCEVLDRQVTVPLVPQRVICLVSGWSEAIWRMGLADQVVGVSKYCRRYVDTLEKVVVGDYLKVDESLLEELEPDLILVTGGVQLGLARRWAKQGRPVFVLPLPDSIAGILENIRKLGALLGAMAAAHRLTDTLECEIARLQGKNKAPGPRVYAELWFGRHPRMAGGLTFVHDIIRIAGGQNIWEDIPEGYPQLDLAAVERVQPEVILLFHEADDHPLDVQAWQRERGWIKRWNFELIECGIEPSRNIIHDGPSIIETLAWLQTQPAFIGCCTD